MSLPLPSASDGYIVLAGHRISVELWNHVIAEIAARIAALEAVKSDLEDAVTLVTTDALELVANSVAPSLADVQSLIADMNALLALAEDRLAAISSGGVVADNVTVQPIDGLEASNAQDAFAEIMGTVIDQIVDLIIPTKLAISAKADKAKAEAGTDNDTWMSPLTGAQQIAALAGDVVVETFTASGTFTKAVGDFLYLVECWAGGGGGNNATTAVTRGGGGGGEYAAIFISAGDITPTVSVLIGAGGSGGAAGGTAAGADGGNSGFGSYLIAHGGRGAVNSAGSGGGGQAPGFGSTDGVSGYASGGGSTGQTTSIGNGGNSTMGGAGGGGCSTMTSGAQVGAGGISGRGGNGGNGNNQPGVKGGNGSSPGGGGGGSSQNGGGGDGARGEVRVTRFKRIKQ